MSVYEQLAIITITSSTDIYVVRWTTYSSQTMYSNNILRSQILHNCFFFQANLSIVYTSDF